MSEGPDKIGRILEQMSQPPLRGRGPITDHVVILPIEASNKAHGMDLPDTNAEMPTRGLVIDVGPGRVTEFGVRVKPEVRPGDTVLYPSYAGVDSIMDLDGELRIYRIVRQDEISYNLGPAAPAEPEQAKDSTPHE